MEEVQHTILSISQKMYILLNYKSPPKIRYDEDGNTRGTPEFSPPSPVRLSWDLDNEACLTAINSAHLAAEKLLNVNIPYISYSRMLA